jgi:hypothetical protein
MAGEVRRDIRYELAVVRYYYYFSEIRLRTQLPPNSRQNIESKLLRSKIFKTKDLARLLLRWRCEMAPVHTSSTLSEDGRLDVCDGAHRTFVMKNGPESPLSDFLGFFRIALLGCFFLDFLACRIARANCSKFSSASGPSVYSRCFME